jgi:hypothetical protein
MIRRLRGTVRDERGVALPLALLGLVSISLLVTAALVNSSTEVAISQAHRDAARALYVAEGGLQSYVAEFGPTLQVAAGRPTFEYRPPSGSAGERVNVTVAGMARQVIPATRELLRVYHVTSQPVQGGGRTVAALVKQVFPPPVPLGLDIQSALTLGSDLHVNGNAYIVSGKSTACGSGGVEAARMAQGAEVTVNNPNHIKNFTGVNDYGQYVQGYAAIQNSGLSRADLAAEVLAGKTLDQLVAQLPPSKKWGPRFSPEGGPVRVFDGVVDTATALKPAEQVAVVDANGGSVELKGGRGLFIVVNGNLEMKGSAKFEGVILVEGSFWLHGNPQVVGALVSLAYDAENRIELIEENALGNGNVTVAYDRCKIQAAQDAFGQITQEDLTPTVQATLGWLEVAR